MTEPTTIEKIEAMLAWLDEGTPGHVEANWTIEPPDGHDLWYLTTDPDDANIACAMSGLSEADARNIAALLNSARKELEALRRMWIDSKYSGEGARLQVRLVIQKIVDIKYKAFKEANGEQEEVCNRSN